MLELTQSTFLVYLGTQFQLAQMQITLVTVCTQSSRCFL